MAVISNGHIQPRKGASKPPASMGTGAVKPLAAKVLAGAGKPNSPPRPK